MSLKVSKSVDDIENLKKQIDYVNKMLQMKTDKSFQEYIQNKVLETCKEVSYQRLSQIQGLTNEDVIQEYIDKHSIREIKGGFELYNDFTLPRSMLAISPKTEGYENGFNIALAFEYGVGIVGENAPKQGAWNYNVNNHNFAWRYKKYNNIYSTYGYEGAEIYRYTAIEVEKQLKTWVNEYFTESIRNKEE